MPSKVSVRVSTKPPRVLYTPHAAEEVRVTDVKRDPRIVPMQDVIGKIANNQALIAKNAVRLAETVSKHEHAAASSRSPDSKK